MPDTTDPAAELFPSGRRKPGESEAEYRARFGAAWEMSNDLAGGFDDVPTTTGNPRRVVAPAKNTQPEGDR